MDEIAIVGIGETPQGHLNKTSHELHILAAKEAMDDCGIGKDEIDGVLTANSFQFHMMHSILISQALGINPKFSDCVQVGGASHCMMVIEALSLIKSKVCEVVLCVSGEALRSKTGFLEESDATEMFSSLFDPSFEQIYGPNLVSGYSFFATRHMALFGTTLEQLAQVSVSARKHAVLNENAFKRDPITIEDVLSSKPISWPLYKDMCSLVTDGGGAFIVTTLRRAKDLKKKPVVVVGYGAKIGFENVTLCDSFTETPLKEAADSAFRMAGISRQDVDFAELYDCFSITPIIFLEDLGFCGKGEGGSFVEGGKRIEIGGDLPINTHGGLLSHSHPGWPGGIFHIIEAVRQLRGEAGKRQINNARIGLVTGNGGIFSAEDVIIFARY